MLIYIEQQSIPLFVHCTYLKRRTRSSSKVLWFGEKSPESKARFYGFSLSAGQKPNRKHSVILRLLAEGSHCGEQVAYSMTIIPVDHNHQQTFCNKDPPKDRRCQCKDNGICITYSNFNGKLYRLGSYES